MKLKKVKSKIPGATEISPSCSAAMYRMGREEITHNAIWFHPQCTLDGIVYMCVYCVCGLCQNGWGGVFCNWKITKCQDLPKFEFSSGGGVFCNWKITKCQDLPKFDFSSGGGGILQLKNHKGQDLPKFEFPRGGILQLKNHKGQDLPKFEFSRGGGYSATEKSKCQDFWQFSFFLGGVFCIAE